MVDLMAPTGETISAAGGHSLARSCRGWPWLSRNKSKAPGQRAPANAFDLIIDKLSQFTWKAAPNRNASLMLNGRTLTSQRVQQAR